jgi:hypothetical protein
MIEYSRALMTRNCELIRAAHISRQVDLMIVTLQKEGCQLWKDTETLNREILISQEEATREPSEGIRQTPLPFPPLKKYVSPAYHRHHLHPEVFEPIFARTS